MLEFEEKLRSLENTVLGRNIYIINKKINRLINTRCKLREKKEDKGSKRRFVGAEIGGVERRRLIEHGGREGEGKKAAFPRC